MKKYILISMLLFLVGMISSAQNAAVDNVLDYDKTYVNFDGTSSDYVYDADSTWSYTINKKTDSKLNVFYRVSLEKTSGTAAATNVYFQSKVFADASFLDIDTISYAGTVDTVIYFNTSSAKSADYWRIDIIKGDNDLKIAVEDIDVKFYK